jgi:hypothetical protein
MLPSFSAETVDARKSIARSLWVQVARRRLLGSDAAFLISLLLLGLCCTLGTLVTHLYLPFDVSKPTTQQDWISESARTIAFRSCLLAGSYRSYGRTGFAPANPESRADRYGDARKLRRLAGGVNPSWARSSQSCDRAQAFLGEHPACMGRDMPAQIGWLKWRHGVDDMAASEACLVAIGSLKHAALTSGAALGLRALWRSVACRISHLGLEFGIDANGCRSWRPRSHHASCRA